MPTYVDPDLERRVQERRAARLEANAAEARAIRGRLKDARRRLMSLDSVTPGAPILDWLADYIDAHPKARGPKSWRR